MKDKYLKYSKAPFLDKALFAGYLTKYEVLVRIYFSVKFRFFCWLNAVDIGNGVTTYGNVFIVKRPLSLITIGDNFQSTNLAKMNGFSSREATLLKTFSTESRITIGERVDINSSSILCRNGSVHIGNDVMIAPNCVVTNSDFHNPIVGKRHESGEEFDRDIVISDGVWIGMNCVILKGVTIGENSIIAAGSVVSNDVPPNSVVGTNPFSILKNV